MHLNMSEAKRDWRFWLIFTGLSVSALLSSLEGTITATAMPEEFTRVKVKIVKIENRGGVGAEQGPILGGVFINCRVAGELFHGIWMKVSDRSFLCICRELLSLGTAVCCGRGSRRGLARHLGPLAALANSQEQFDDVPPGHHRRSVASELMPLASITLKPSVTHMEFVPQSTYSKPAGLGCARNVDFRLCSHMELKPGSKRQCRQLDRLPHSLLRLASVGRMAAERT